MFILPYLELDFDVTKFASEENRFNEHSVDHPEKVETSPDQSIASTSSTTASTPDQSTTGTTTAAAASSTPTTEEKSNVLKDPEPAELFITRKAPGGASAAPNPNMEKTEATARGEIEDVPKSKTDMSLNEAFSEPTKRKEVSDSNDQQKVTEKHSHIKSGAGKKSGKWVKRGKSGGRHSGKGEQGEDEEQYENFMHFNGPMPFMQIPDPTQFAPDGSDVTPDGPVQAEENENLLHPSFGNFNPNRIPTIVDLPVHTSFFDNRNVPGFDMPENAENAEEYEAMKRSDVPDMGDPARSGPLFDGDLFLGKGEVVADKPERTRRGLIEQEEVEDLDDGMEDDDSPDRILVRSRRDVDVEEDTGSDENDESNFLLTRSKRSDEQDENDDEEEDDDDKSGPHVVKRSAILSEFIPSKKSQRSRARSNVHVRTKGASKGVSTRTGSKRSGVRKSDILDAKKTELKESSSVLNIIKRVHDDIALGNSKDLRTLESELAKLEGISISESNEQVKTFETMAKNNKQREGASVRTRVAKTRVKEKEDPDEYYKYGATASGKLESWTLHFYGTGG